ncbi:hypothetical protein PRVXH_000282 [Proteinivorax hydrogeniformans]|uniref:ABC transporter permease n=1 Tax=Proteinivorax hydrogeniformans TaxID=1826727 RepID=A0AAU8HUC5_9FIRM
MENSNFKKLMMLFKKDLMNLKFESLILLGLIVVGYSLIIFRVQATDDMLKAAVIGNLSFLIFFGTLLIIFIRSFSLVSNEWKNKTLYMIMPLPVKGKTIFLSKIMAITTQTIVISGISMAFLIAVWTTIIGLGEVQQALNTLMVNSSELISEYKGEIIKVIILGFFSFISLIVTVFFSSVVGRMFKKMSGLITFITFLLTNYAISKITSITHRLIGIETSIQTSTAFDTVEASVEVFSIQQFWFYNITTVIITLALFFATTYLYDQKVEL